MRNDVLNLGDLSLFGKNERGYILITTMIALGVVAVLATSALGWALTGLRLSRKAVESEQAFYMANAGIEEALARVLAGQTPVDFSQVRPVAAGLSGTYSVTMRTEDDESITVVSQGSVGGTTRLVTARMLPGESGGGDPGDPGGGPGGDPVGAPPGIPPEVFQQVARSNGTINIENNAAICGDLFSSGSVFLGNNIRVFGTATSPCTSVTGTGTVVAAGTVSLGTNSVADGGWCDSNDFNRPGHPCATQPVVPTQPFPSLAGQSTMQYNGNLTLAGSKTYHNDIYWINGSVTFDHKGVQISGAVTFYVNGNVNIDGDLTCSGPCSIAIVQNGSLTTKNNLEIWATLMVNGFLSLGNSITLHGNIQASTMDVGTNLVLYPLAVGTEPGPPPGDGTGPGLTDWSS